MKKTFDFTYSSDIDKSNPISENFIIDPNSVREEILNIFIHLELFFDKLGLPPDEVHSTYLGLLDSFGILQKYNIPKDSNSDAVNEIILRDFDIETFDKFFSKIKEDRGFAFFIYDFIKEKL